MRKRLRACYCQFQYCYYIISVSWQQRRVSEQIHSFQANTGTALQLILSHLIQSSLSFLLLGKVETIFSFRTSSIFHSFMESEV